MRNTEMRHFSLEEWADFTNQNVGRDKQTFMEHHLEASCSHCERIISSWRSLKDFGLQESQIEVPQGAVALAKAAFLTHRKRPKPGALAVFAQLIFDSFRQPELAGVRSGSADSRCLLYRAGPVLIDLSLDLTQQSGHVALQGQVMDSETEAKGIEEIPVSLQSGQETLAHTQTNEFGEFELACNARKSLQVSVAVNPQKNVLIMLDEMVWTARQNPGAAH
jgi:hypothetical protein